MQVVCADYDYAGFHYCVLRTPDGSLIADPLPAQHAAAAKAKHRQAAVECYQQDYPHDAAFANR